MTVWTFIGRSVNETRILDFDLNDKINLCSIRLQPYLLFRNGIYYLGMLGFRTIIASVC